jgi:hypothetical protein
MPLTWISLLKISLIATTPAGASYQPVRDDPCTPARPAYGPTIVVPLEVAQGVSVGRGSPAPYAASIRLYPTYVLDRKHQTRFAVAGGLVLVNPKLEGVIGARLSRSLLELNTGPLRGIGLLLGVEGLYGTSDRGLLGVMLIGDLGGAFQATIRGEQDVTNGATLLELGLGFHVYDRSPREVAPVLPEPPSDYLGKVAERMAITFKEAIAEARSESVAACRSLVSAAQAFVRQRASARSIAAFREALKSEGLARVESLMDVDEPPPAPGGLTEAEVVQALYQGIRDPLRADSGS